MASKPPLPRTRPDAPRSLRPPRPDAASPSARPSSELPAARLGSAPAHALEAPPLWRAQLAHEIRNRASGQDLGVVAIHLAHVPAMVTDIGTFVATRAMTTTLALLEEKLGDRGQCTRHGPFELLLFVRTPQGRTVLDAVDRLVSVVASTTLPTSAGNIAPKLFVGCARWSEEDVDEHTLVAKSLRRLERAKVEGRRLCFSDA